MCSSIAIGYSRTAFDIFRNVPENPCEHFLEISKLLEENEELKLSCYFSGFWLENADHETLQALTKLGQSNQVEIISGLYFEPYLPPLTVEEIEAHLELTEEFWGELGIPKLSGLWLNNSSWHEGLEQVLRKHEIRYVVDAGGSPVPPSNQETFLIPRLLHDHLIVFSQANPETASVYQNTTPTKVPEGPRVALINPLSENKNETFLHPDFRFQPISPESLRHSISAFSASDTSFLLTVAEHILEQGSKIRIEPYEPQYLQVDPSDESEAQNRFYYRMLEIRQTLATLPDFIEEHGEVSANRERYRDALRWLLRSQYRRESGTSLSLEEKYRLFRESYAALLYAQVEADAIRNTNIDPADGWVNTETIDFRQDESSEYIVDNPFLRLYFDPSLGGALTEFDYKPRKLNLLNNLCGRKRNTSFIGAFFSTLQDDYRIGQEPITKLEAASFSIPRQNPNFATLRLCQPLNAIHPNSNEKYSLELCKDFTFHGGVGAHLQYSTTGFTIEYWLEGPLAPPEGFLFGLEWTFMLPSGNPDGMSARPLLCVGGESEKVWSLADSTLLKPEDAPGGVYGVRLIDGIEGYIVECRSAKALSLLEIVSLPSESSEKNSLVYGGTRVRFISDAKKLYGQKSMNTLFLSIP